MSLSSKLLGAALGLVLAGSALAADKVQITSDTFTVTESSHEAVFTGNVVVVHPTVTVHADKVVATYGAGGTTDIKTFVATGNVTLQTSEQTATGERAVFTPSDHMLRLTDNVLVTNSSGTVGAGELVVNLDTNVSTFSAAKGGRVTGVFTSQ